MTTKGDLQTLLAYFDELSNIRDDVEQFSFFLDALEVITEDLRREEDTTNPNANTKEKRRERASARHQMIEKLLKEAKTARQQIEDSITHIWAYKATPYLEELIQDEENKLAKSNGTKSPNLV